MTSLTMTRAFGFRLGRSGLTIALGTALGLGSLLGSAAGQTVTRAIRLAPAQGTAIVPATGVTPTVILADDGQVVTEAVTSSVDDTDSQRTALLQGLTVDRRPSAMLQAWAEPPAADVSPAEPADTEPPGAESEGAETTPEQQALQALERRLPEVSRAITLGHWDEVAAFLAELDSTEAQAVYQQLLQGLAATPTSVPVDLPEEIRQQLLQWKQMQAQQRPGQPEQNQIDWDVIRAVIEMAPEPLETEQLKWLGQLGRLAESQGHAVHDWLESLRAMTQATDETPTLSRRQAARLLAEAGRAIEAAEFLPSLDEAQATADLEALNLLTRHHLAQYAQTTDRKFLQSAWQATQAVLGLEIAGADQQVEKEEALKRAVDLAPQIEDTLGLKWLHESFRGDASRGQEILATIGAGAARGLENQVGDADTRRKGLELQETAVAALLEVAPERADEWRDVLSLLATNWLREARATYQWDRSTGLNPIMQRDVYGNFYYVDPRQAMSSPASRQIAAISTGDLLELRPSEAWLERVEPSLRGEFTRVLAQLYLKVSQEEQAFPYIEQLAADDPQLAQELVDEFLRIWTENHDPNARGRQTSSYIYMYGFEQRAQSIPLTRSKQQRNLEELSGWIARLRELPVELDEKQVLQAFTTCHSTAEVYRLEAIKQVFGALEGIEPDTLAALAQGMRANLGGLWREPATQETAKTRRRKKDIQAEVERGYAVAKTVVEEALERFPDSWSLQLAQAALIHDENNYLAEIAPSQEFAGRQRDAFAMFQQAAATYLQQAPELLEDEWTVEPFELWFYASLGSCDLGQLDVDKRPDPRQPLRIREALDSLPKPIAEEHFNQFANQLFTRMSAVKPEAKFRYLKGGFEIVGDHPQAQEAREVYEYYQDLVTEIELRAEIDGSDVIGHEQPFGVFVSLRHTPEIERESGGFGRYLQNQNTGTQYYYNYGRPLENYRDKFEDMARKALGDDFEVLSVTFQSEDVNSRATEQSPWRETPYAYLLLQARGPEVDELSPLRLDLDFLDTSGYVVLPIESPVVPLVASRESDEPRPYSRLSLTQTLDERQAGEGKLILEIRASAEGLVPELDTLVDLETPGFERVNVEDQGVSVSRFDPESSDKKVLSERTWLVTYEAVADEAALPKSYSFAAPKIETTETMFQRYEDADLVSVPETIQLQRRYGKRSLAWLIWVLAAMGLVGGALAVGWRLKRRQPVEIEQTTLEPPKVLTPFSVLSWLDDLPSRLDLSQDEQQELSQTRLRIEAVYFGRRNGEPEPDLADITRQWSKRSRGPRA